MVFIFNTKLTKNSRLLKALQQIFGLGKNSINRLEKEFGLTQKMLVKQLKIRLKKRISNFVNDSYVYGQKLKIQKLYDEINIRNLRNYKGMRKRFNLPQRGQRTRTNARTIRNKKKNEKK